VSFQWNPSEPDWGNIAWGSATSPNLVHWDVQSAPSIEPETAYDCKGVFTGCYLPTTSNKQGNSERVMTVAYTSANDLPIHHTLPHVQGSESLSLAQLFDDGRIWHKHPRNPILHHEPSGLNFAGFRDPFVAPLHAMSELLSLNPDETLFGVISGGIRDVTPTTFLYAIDQNNPIVWKYVVPLANIECNLRMSRRSVDLGRN
jgi:beta-fructofuranosidase